MAITTRIRVERKQKRVWGWRPSKKKDAVNHTGRKKVMTV